MGYSLKEPTSFFHKLDQNVPPLYSSHSLRVLSKCTQKFNHHVCHDFRRFPTFLCLSPKRPHSFTQPMTCFPFPFPHLSYLLPHLLSYLLIRSFRIPRTSQVYSVYSETRILRPTEGVLPTGKSPALQTPPCTYG